MESLKNVPIEEKKSKEEKKSESKKENASHIVEIETINNPKKEEKTIIEITRISKTVSDKDKLIKDLQEQLRTKERIIIEKDRQYKELKKDYNNLFNMNEKNKKDLLTANNQIKSLTESKKNWKRKKEKKKKD